MEQKSNKHMILVTSMIYFAVTLVMSAIFYNIMPTVLNYPEGTVGGTFQKELEGIVYSIQYAGITISILIVSFIIIYIRLRKLLRKDIDVENIRKIYLEAPQKIYVSMILIESILIVIIHALSIKAISITTFKIWIFFFSSITLSCAFAYILTKGFFTKQLTKLNLPNKPHTKRVGIRKEIYMETIPIFMSAILFTALVGYTRIVNEKGEVLSKVYLERIEHVLDKNEYASLDEIRNKLSTIKLENSEDKIYFYDISTANSFGIDNNQIELSSYFKKYLVEKSQEDNRVYDYYGVDIQGVSKKVNIQNNDYYIGVIYYIKSVQALRFLVLTFIGAFFTNILVIYVFAKTLSDNITLVTDKLNELSNNENVDLDRKLPITSNNEIGDLASSFNKILELEKENVETKERNKDIMIEQERLSSLGQLIGGVAHNLKTPIMSIAGVVEGLTDLIKEYDESIDDPSVNKDDHHEIAKDMQNWVDKVKPYLSYMTEVIDAVKGQAVSMNASTMTNFTIKELITRTQLLMKNELKRRHCNLNLDITANEFTAISGEISALIQVIDNMIINAMDAYGDKAGDVDIKVREDDNKVYIDVTDYAGGIPQKVQDKLFKEMITSKGKNGTGLGLYMSFSTIKGKFKGDIRYETEEGKGTTFFIELPKYVG